MKVSASLLLLLGLVAAGMSLFSDTVIAALPALQAALAASDPDVQQLVSLFFVATAFMSLFAGALADAYGRRPVLFGSLLLLVLTSVGCIVSVRIQQLWVLRTLQGAAACVGMILSRTIIRDLASGLEAQKMIGRVSLIQSLFPVLTPLLGAWVATRFGWRMVFVCTGALTLLMLPMLLGLLLLPRLLRNHRPRTVVVGAYGCYLVGISANLAVGALEIHTLVALGPLAVFSFAIGCTVPLLVGEALEPFPDNAGMASSCQLFLQYIIMGLTAGVLAPLAWHSLLSLAIAQAGMVAAGFMLLLWQGRLSGRKAAVMGCRA